VSDFKLKLVLSVLGGVVFSFVFILLAFALPVKKKQEAYSYHPKGKLETISHSMKKR